MKLAAGLTDILTLGAQSMTRHLVRSLLAAMSIIFAVWSVIAMLAINEGVARQALAELEKLGSTNLIVTSEKPTETSNRASDSQSGASIYGLTMTDAVQLRDNMPGVVRCITVRSELKYALAGINQETVAMVATEPAFFDTAHLTLSRAGSRFLTHADALRQRNVAVITENLADRLFAYRSAIGQTVRLNREPFVVVGVVERSADHQLIGVGTPQNYQVFVPYATARQRFGEYNLRREQGTRVLEKVEVKVAIYEMADEEAVLAGASIARNLLGRLREQQDYSITVPLELIEQKRAQQRLWNIMFFVIAAISLIVGGIGIANVMLASVTERTREIGIRRALGAKKHDIVVQFLVEAVALTTVGGMVGILIGVFAVPQFVNWLVDLQAVIEAKTLLLPLAMAVLVGLASGVYPAIRAANLDPIEALRHE